MTNTVLKNITEDIKGTFPMAKVFASIDERNIVTLEGDCESWQMVVDIGHLVAANVEVKNVVNNLSVNGKKAPSIDYMPVIEKGEKIGVIDSVDVVIVGAGITGCAIARELSKYDLKIVVVETGDDVAYGSSRANNGCIHHGMDCKPGTLKAKLNILGNRRYDDWERELHIGFKRCGCLEIVENAEDMHILQKRYEKGVLNGVDGIEIVSKERAYEIEPTLKENGTEVYAGLYMPSHGVVETMYVCIALAENAADNGVKFMFNCMVGKILYENHEIQAVVTERGIIKTKYVVDAAGMYADDIAEMAGDKMYTIHNRKGVLAVFDKSVPPTYNTLFANLSKHVGRRKDAESKGGGANPTPENNLLAGPSAIEVWDKEDVETTPEGIEYIKNHCMQDPNSNVANIIRIFAGARPADYKEDFTVEMSEITKGFIHASGIQSPGVASAPAIADVVVELIVEDVTKSGKQLELKKDYNPIRERQVEFRHMTHEQQAALVKKDPRYGKIVCRCELVTEGEIIDAIKSPVVPCSINAIKNRTRAGMGRCQGGFCQPRVLEILARELGQEWIDINLKGQGSNILMSNNREGGR